MTELNYELTQTDSGPNGRPGWFACFPDGSRVFVDQEFGRNPVMLDLMVRDSHTDIIDPEGAPKLRVYEDKPW
jgi:hypothetical protein